MLLHIRTTKKCNMNCKGCYSPLLANNSFFNYSTKNLTLLNNFIKEYMEFINSNEDFLELNYLGGEVSLSNIETFKNIREELNKNWNINDGIQTNLIMKKEKLDEFFKIFNKNISTSYNFDKSRRINSSWKIFKTKFLENYKYFYKKYNLKLPIVCLITSNNVKDMYKIYKFCNNNEIGVVFTWFKPMGEGKNLFDLIPNRKEYAKKILQINNDKNRKINVFPLDQMKDIKNGKLKQACGWQNDCVDCSLCVESDNKVFTCSEIAELEKDFSISEDMKSINQQNYVALKKRKFLLPKECLECNVFEYCKGGCMAESYSYNKDLYGKTYMCEAWKIIFNEI